MRHAFFAAVAISATAVASAAAADLAVRPSVGPVPAFSWSGCYFGMHGGGAFAGTEMTDPVQLAQNDVLGSATGGGSTVHVSPGGAVVGGQLGCDLQFAPHWVAGIEGTGSGATLKGTTAVGLPGGLGGDQALVSTTTDFLPSVTGRLGYTIDRALIYGKAGVAWASSKYTVTGSLEGTSFDLEGFATRTGWTAGAGVEWAFSRNWSVNVEYDCYAFGAATSGLIDSLNPAGFAGALDAKQTIQVVKAGVNFHLWSGW